MTIRLQIAFEGLPASDSLRQRIRAETQKLEKFQDRIIGCRVVVRGRSRRRAHGDLYAIRVHITTSGSRDIVIDRNPDADHAHEDAYVAIRDAFNAARRRLQDRHRRLEGKMKAHAEPSRGRVLRLHKDGYGFIETRDGREVYFHRNALRNGVFARLSKGASVQFWESETDGRVQASSVHLAADT
jgi:cold shock CspA family protein/ribosome-associated translation inhibitor RaiA